MLDKIVKVSECPSDVREACVGRGQSPDAEITITAAMEHWSGWNFGDPTWGNQAAYFVWSMNNQGKAPA